MIKIELGSGLEEGPEGGLRLKIRIRIRIRICIKATPGAN